MIFQETESLLGEAGTKDPVQQWGVASPPCPTETGHSAFVYEFFWAQRNVILESFVDLSRPSAVRLQCPQSLGRHSVGTNDGSIN